MLELKILVVSYSRI